MHRLILWHSFAELILQILLFGLLFYFLNKKKANVHGNAENSDTGASSSLTVPAGTNLSGSSSTSIETTNGATSLLTELSGNCYDVFLSFRGKDTRKNFTDHLYHGLIRAGISTFRDNDKLRHGKKISPELFAAIENSKILIPILSVHYGTSSWCLNELVQIMECKNKKGHIVLPIFYKVKPSEVCYQKGSFGEAFHEHESRLCTRGFNPAILKKWKEALNDVSSLRGWDDTRPEGELVNLVVEEVLGELIEKFELDTPEDLIGIDSHVEKVMKFIDNNSHAPLFVGIHGMGGIGKTTIAKIIYNKLSNQFKYRSFIADIREKFKFGVDHLQNQLIHDTVKEDCRIHSKDEGIKVLSSNLQKKKVLILLDDVDADDHLKYLARSHNWFFWGSVIIITTRDESILDRAYVDFKHEAKELDIHNSLILFSRHAFRKDTPPSEFEKFTDEVVSTTGGLPLSLEVLGSFLRNKEQGVWEDMIKKLRNVPDKKVLDTLKISYDALASDEQQIFLDIACFFIGTDWRIASYMWDACGFYPKKGIAVLRLMSLIKVGEYHEIKMHDHLRDLGREIVRKEDEKEPQNRSRLLDSREVLEMLKEDEGTKNIEAIYFNKGDSEGFGKTIYQGDNILMGEKFMKLRNLRFLEVRGASFSGDFKDSMKNLKLLHWEYYPSPFEATNFHVKELLVLKLWGRISDKWQGWSFIKMAKDLKYLNLAYCRSLKRTSFLSAFENLEVLILKECEKLKQIDSSIGNMKRLVCLDLRGCGDLRGKELPAEVGELKELRQLLLGHTGISLPDSIWALPNLEILDIEATTIENLPESVGALQNLIILDIDQTKIKKLPNGIGRLSKLRDLSAQCCNELEGEIPESIYNLSFLQRLSVSLCKNLSLRSVLPSSLKHLKITCQNRRLPSLSNLTHLKELVLFECKFLEFIWEHPSTLLEKSMNTPFELEILEICRCKLVKTMDVSQFNYLRKLCVEDCNSILEIRGLNKLKYLESLEITACAIERFDLSESKGLRLLEAKNCEKLVEIQGLNKLEYLEGIVIAGCTSIVKLDLRKSKDIKRFNAKNCVRLVEIQGLDRWESLEGIIISGCISITRLDLQKSEAMKIINAQNCKNLVEIQGLDRLESLKEIDISGCSSIARLSLPKSKDLKIFNAKNCENLVENQALYRLESSKMLDYCAYDSIKGMHNYPMGNGWDYRKLYGGLYESLYKV